MTFQTQSQTALANKRAFWDTPAHPAQPACPGCPTIAAVQQWRQGFVGQLAPWPGFARESRFPPCRGLGTGKSWKGRRMKPESALGASSGARGELSLCIGPGKRGWQGREDSNLQPLVPETSALAIELRPCRRGQRLLEDPGSGEYTFMGCPGQRGNVSPGGLARNARLRNGSKAFFAHSFHVDSQRIPAL